MYTSSNDLNSIIIDAGTYSTRIGYAGEDIPRCYEISHIGQIDKEIHFDINKYHDNMTIEPYIQDGMISNWDLYEQMINYNIYNRMKGNLKESPVIITEKAYNTQASRHK